MYRDHHRMSPWVLTAVALACLACTSRDTASADSDTAQGDTAVAAAETEQAPATPAGGSVESEPVDAPLTVADIERWERGQRAELAEVEEAFQKLKTAKTAMDTLSVQLSVQDTDSAGARAAGVSVQRYEKIDDMIGRVLSARMMGEAMKKSTAAAAADTVNMPAEVRAKMRQGLAQTDSAFGADPFKDLPPDVAAVLKPRAAQLDTLRWTLIGARMGKTLTGDPKP